MMTKAELQNNNNNNGKKKNNNLDTHQWNGQTMQRHGTIQRVLIGRQKPTERVGVVQTANQQLSLMN